MQANTIVLRIRAEQAAEFEQLFADEEMPIWKDMADQGSLVQASLTRVAFGSEEEDGIQLYVIYAAFTSMAGHTAHDEDPRFKAMLTKARAFQPKSPLVFGGRTLFDAGAEPSRDAARG